MVVEKIQERVKALPPSLQREVLDFIEYLLSKTERDIMERERAEWTTLSLELALRDMENEVTPEYTYDDVKVVFS